MKKCCETCQNKIHDNVKKEEYCRFKYWVMDWATLGCSCDFNDSIMTCDKWEAKEE